MVPDWAVLSIFNLRCNSERPPYWVYFLLDPSIFSFVTQSASCYTRKCAATRVKTFQAPNRIKFFSHCSSFECSEEPKKKTGVKITEKYSLCKFERKLSVEKKWVVLPSWIRCLRMLLKSWFLEHNFVLFHCKGPFGPESYQRRRLQIRRTLWTFKCALSLIKE